MPPRLVRRMLRRLDASPLPISDPVRLELEAELLEQLLRLKAVETARRGRLLGTRQPMAVS